MSLYDGRDGNWPNFQANLMTQTENMYKDVIRNMQRLIVCISVYQYMIIIYIYVYIYK